MAGREKSRLTLTKDERIRMPCRPLKSVYFAAYQKPAEVLRALESELHELAAICLETDFSDHNQRDLFERNIIFIKGYYERYERLIRDSANEGK